MEVTLYQFGKRANSTLQPDDNIFHEDVSNVQLKEDTSLYNPTFLLTPKWLDIRYNYLKWNNKYYWIDDVINVNVKGCYEYICSMDLLASFKSDILDTIAYIKYSYVNFNNAIPDDRISFPLIKSVDVYNKEVFSDNTETSIVIQYISAKDSYYGSVATGVINTTNLRSLNALLMSDSFSDSYEKQIDSTASSIVGCKLFPINISGDVSTTMTILNTSTSINIALITGDGLKRGTWTILSTSQLSELVGTDDFRNYSPYTTYNLYLPCYGYVAIEPTYLKELLLEEKTFDIQYIIDVINGSITYVIWGIGKFDCAFAVNIPTAYSGINAINTISNGISAGAGIVDALFGGGITSAIQSTYNTTISATQKIAGTIGSSSGSMASIKSDPLYHGSNDFHIQLIKTTLKENTSSYLPRAVMGSPNNKVDALSNYSGYVQTVGISVTTNLPKVYADELNAIIDSGIFIE